MFLVAGGPGEASAQVFDLAGDAKRWRRLFPGYTLVAFDPRGTGQSGPLRCPSIDSLPSAPAEEELPALLARCADEIGPERAFYTTRDHVDDLDAVRQALGVDRIGIWGTSYGTKLAVAYAQAYPFHVARLLLDSTLPLEGPDPFALDVLKGMPAALRTMCADGSCRSITSNFERDFVELANALAKRPIRGQVAETDGLRLTKVLDGVGLLELLTATDRNPGLSAELPAAVAAARAGRPLPLLRLGALIGVTSGLAVAPYNGLLGLVTTCEDGRFPWRPDLPIEERQPVLEQFLASLPAGATGPFGLWAAAAGTAEICRYWPPPAGNAPLVAGAFPDVPVLVLSGTADVRTPTAGGVGIAGDFPQGRVLLVPGAGHSVLNWDLVNGCAEEAVRHWLDGSAPVSRCEHVPPFVRRVGPLPASLAAIAPERGVPGSRGRTLAAVQRTVTEAVAAWLAEDGEGALTGLYGGQLKAGAGLSFSLAGYSDVPGLAITGKIKLEVSLLSFFDSSSPAIEPKGTVTVTGSRAVPGLIKIDGADLHAAWTSHGRAGR
jgi:pimeloyl-ACP methyl ester carboxylesterase